MKLKSKFEFLNEGRSQKITFDTVKNLIRENCQQWLHKKEGDQYTFFRGIKSDNDFLKIDPSTEVRSSLEQDNKSFYFPIIDRWSGFPKRSQSIICSTSHMYAAGFGNCYLVIPYDNANLAIFLSAKDIWYAYDYMKLNTLNYDIDSMIREFNRTIIKGDTEIFMVNSYEDIIKLSDWLLKYNKEFIEYTKLYTDYRDVTGKIIEYGSLLKYLESELTPENLKCSTTNYKSFTLLDTKCEVWTDSKAILLKYDTNIVKDLKNFVDYEIKK